MLTLYAVEIAVTRAATVHVVAESVEEARAMAHAEGAGWVDDCDDHTDETDVTVKPAAPGSWGAGELPYLSRAADDQETALHGRVDATCGDWHEVLRAMEPGADTRTAPLALVYDDGHVERVAAVPQAAGGSR